MLRLPVEKEMLIFIFLFVGLYFSASPFLQKVHSEGEEVVEMNDPDKMCSDHPEWLLCQQREPPIVNPTLPVAEIDPDEMCPDHPERLMCQQRVIPDLNPTLPVAEIENLEDIDHDERRAQARVDVNHDERREQVSMGEGIEVRIR